VELQATTRVTNSSGSTSLSSSRPSSRATSIAAPPAPLELLGSGSYAEVLPSSASISAFGT
jgi:hypothetical protein